MTAYYGTNSTKRRATPAQPVNNGDQGGRERVSYDEIATTTAMTTADTIEIGLLPADARVTGIEVAWVAHGSGRTMSIGDGTDADAFLASTSIAAAGSSNVLPLAGLGYRNTTGAALPIIVTLAGGTLAANSAGLKVALRFVQD